MKQAAAGMLDVFRGLKGLVKISHVTIDSTIFRLHYSVSVSFLLAFSLIVTTRQYVGNPIDCVHTKDIPEDVLNTYCWIHSTYTIPSAFWKRIGIDVAHPGIDKTIDPEERRYVKYYQWVCFCLFFQVREGKSREGDIRQAGRQIDRHPAWLMRIYDLTFVALHKGLSR